MGTCTIEHESRAFRAFLKLKPCRYHHYNSMPNKRPSSINVNSVKYEIKLNSKSINYLLIFLLSLINQVQTSGLFELDIIKYENYYFNDTSLLVNPFIQSYSSLWPQLIGHHWSYNNYNSSNHSNHHLNSNLVYNLCLKEPKARILGKPCTFGEIQASVKFPNQAVTLKEKFTFRWTVSVHII